MRILAGEGCCQGNETSRVHLEAAKALIRRFSLVLDIACLDQGMMVLADLLNISLHQKKSKSKEKLTEILSTRKTPRERVGHDDVYDFMVDRNRLNIELYEWSKSLALVNCSALTEAA